MSEPLCGQAKYSAWVPTGAFPDTREISGFVQSRSLAEQAGEDEALEDSCFDDGSASGSRINEAVPLHNLNGSASALAKMQGVRAPAMAITTEAEKKNFDATWLNYLRTGSQHTAVDFERMVLDWNEHVRDIEEGKAPMATIFRKTAAHLKAYWTK